MTEPRPNQRMNVAAPEGGNKLRIYHSTAKPDKKLASVRIKCGCCTEQVIICHDAQTLEINGVIASIEEWNRVLGPLLARSRPNQQ